MDNYFELFTDCLVSAKPILETLDREQIKAKLSNPTTVASLVLSSVDEVLHQLIKDD